MDRSGVRPQETETLLQTPDTRAGERIPLQRLRFETEALGTGQESDVDGTAGEDLVPEPAHEEQEEHAAAGSAGQQ